MQKQSSYRSYLLRLWRVGSAVAPTWRAALQSTRSGEVVHFADLDSLVAYLVDVSRMTEGDKPAGR